MVTEGPLDLDMLYLRSALCGVQGLGRNWALGVMVWAEEAVRV